MSVGEKSMVWCRLASLRLSGRIVALAAIALAICLFSLPLAYAVSGVPGLVAACTAALVCLVGGEAGLLIANCFRGPAAGMNGALAAMMVRMAIPLVAGVALHLASPMLAAAGMIFYLIGFYMVDLAAETVLLVASLGDSATAVRESA